MDPGLYNIQSLRRQTLAAKKSLFRKQRDTMANTKNIESTEERKKIKRAARKKAAPKGPRSGPRGAAKQKLKKAARGQSKR
jgi:hypothetical protein